MDQTPSPASRAGSILPLMLVCLAALCAFVALAVDIGRIALARTQCQNAADAAATAGARLLDGSPGGNTQQATDMALATTLANEILSEPIASAEVAIQQGTYHYDYSREAFAPQFPPVPPDNYNLTQVTITHSVSTTFAWIFGISSVKVSASACAAHRPRDVCLLVDFAGSLNNESDLWNTEPAPTPGANSSNHSDPVFPRFGWYDPGFSPLAGLQCSGDGTGPGRCNITQAVADLPPLVNDFFQNEKGAGVPVPAFSPAPDSLATSPEGDRPAVDPNKGGPARTWEEITGSASFPFLGYEALNETFHGWTQGPGYWGKTFFLWPADPSTDQNNKPRDWRKRYFFLADGVTPNNDNRQLPLAGADGAYPDPAGHYAINYRAILAWIREYCVQRQPGDGLPFPPQLRGGNILYYDQVPEDVPRSTIPKGSSTMPARPAAASARTFPAAPAREMPPCS
jgi:hypothetical protein